MKHQLDKLWQGQVKKVYLTLQGQWQKWEEKAGNNAHALEAIETLEGYLREHEGRIDYPRYQKRGLRVGSGVIEGACKNVVGG